MTGADGDEVVLGRVGGSRLEVLDHGRVGQRDEVELTLVEVVGQAAAIALGGEGELADDAVPVGLEALNAQAVEALQIYADAFNQIATALSNLDPGAIQAVQSVLGEGDALMTQVIEDLNAVAANCGLEGIPTEA